MGEDLSYICISFGSQHMSSSVLSGTIFRILLGGCESRDGGPIVMYFNHLRLRECRSDIFCEYDCICSRYPEKHEIC